VSAEILGVSFGVKYTNRCIGGKPTDPEKHQATSASSFWGGGKVERARGGALSDRRSAVRDTGLGSWRGKKRRVMDYFFSRLVL